MANRRKNMRYTREVLRLHFECNLGKREIARCCNISPTTASAIVARAEELKLTWPLADYPDNELYTLLWGDGYSKPLPDLDYILKELKRKGVTRQLLWEEYKVKHPDGYGYTSFCELIKNHKVKQEPVMRQDYRFGEMMMVDWAGQTINYRDKSGKQSKAYLFVATLPASNYTYANVYKSMQQGNWIQAHIDSFEYFRGVPELLICDNAKTAVTKACRYDPEYNPAYQQLAEFYGIAVQATRSRAPRDKAKVETAVQISERWILAKLRDVTFLNFYDLRLSVLEKLEDLNTKKFSKMDGNRKTLFEEEIKTLSPLPQDRYQFGHWQKATVANDYHIQVKYHYYSVPFRYMKKVVDVHICNNVIEIYYDHRRIASHVLSTEKGKATTDESHRPPLHSEYINRSVNDYLSRATVHGELVLAFVAGVMNTYPRPEMSFRGANGVFRLIKQYDIERINRACKIAVDNQMFSYQHLNNILKNNRDKIAAEKDPIPINHKNIRGKNSYKEID